jgi:hypothetical protein
MKHMRLDSKSLHLIFDVEFEDQLGPNDFIGLFECISL